MIKPHKKIMKKNHLLTLLLAAVPAAVLADVSHPDASMADSSRVYDLDAVVVVAQPKEQQRLRQQPLSSDILSGEALQRAGWSDLRGASSYVPNFVMPSYGSRLTSSVYVRGIGSRINAPAVGIYVDGIPLWSKSAFNTYLYDVSRLDVLRGAQGTLYGMNTEGGLVRVYTADPLRSQGTTLTAGTGSHSRINGQLTHAFLLSKNLGILVGGFYNGQHGFFHNSTLDRRADDTKEAGGRFKMAWTPSERWRVNLLADYQYTHQNGFPYGLMDEETGHTADPATNHLGFYRRNLLVTGLDATFHANAFDLNAVTSYQYLKDYMLMDIDYLPQELMTMEQRQFQNSFSQELTLKSRRPDAFWRWTLGGIFSAQWLKTQAPVNMNYYPVILSAMVSSMMQRGLSAEAAAAAAKASLQRMGMTEESGMNQIPGLFHTPVYNLGFYHQSDFRLAPRLTLTAGLRYDYSHVSIDYETSASLSMMGVTVSSLLAHQDHNDFNQLLPRLGLTWQIDRLGSNVYASVTKGYRAGGFNIQMFSDILSSELQGSGRQRGGTQHDEAFYSRLKQVIAYDPETSWNYEAGTHLNLFEGSVQFDLSAFYMQVHDLQVSHMAGRYGFGRMMTNAGRSRSCGLEASLRGHALQDRLSYRLAYGYTHATFRDYRDSVRTTGGYEVVSYKGKRVPFIPEHTFSAAADYRLSFARGVLKALTFGADVTAQGRTFWDEANTVKQNFYAVLGARLQADFGPLACTLWGHNLTGTDYNAFAVSSAASGQTHWFAQRGNPFTWGIDVKWRF